MALLITCSFCPGEYVLFKTAPLPRDMRACVHHHELMRACECTRMPPLDMRGIARIRACDCMRMPPLDMRACACECTCTLRTDHVFLLSRRLRSLRNRAAAARHARLLLHAHASARHARHCAHARLRLHAHAEHRSRVPSVQASMFSSKPRRRRAEEKSSRGPEAAADAAPAAAAERGCDGVQGPPAPAAAGGAVDA
jgi:hypothetical protein